MNPRSPRFRDLAQLAIGVACVLLVLFIVGFVRLRWDLTSEKRYTLTHSTRQLVQDFKDVMWVRVYLSGELPADLRQLSIATRDMLKEMQAINPENLQFEFIDPNAEPDEKTRFEHYEQLQKDGLNHTSVRTNKGGAREELIAWPGAFVEYQGNRVPVQLLRAQSREADADMINGSINNLEYELSAAMRRAMAAERPKIAFLSGHGEVADMRVNDIANALGEQYSVERVKLEGQLDILSSKLEQGAFRFNQYDLLVVVKPDSSFSLKDQYIIDQFVMNGGRMLWVLDPMNAHLDSLREKQFSIATPLELDLDRLLFAQGIRLNKDIVLDKQSALIPIYTTQFGDKPRLEHLPFPYEPIAIPGSMHPIVNNIDPVHFRFVSSIDTIATDSLRHSILLTSSAYSRAMRNPVRISLAAADRDLGLERNSTPYLPLAVLVEGNFRSAFADRMVMADTTLRGIGHREWSPRTAVMVVGDGDAILNRVDHERKVFYSMGYDPTARTKLYGNREFFINAVNYLLQDEAMIDTRTRSISLRKLDVARTEHEASSLKTANVALPIVITVLFGGLFAYLRKRRYVRSQ